MCDVMPKHIFYHCITDIALDFIRYKFIAEMLYVNMKQGNSPACVHYKNLALRLH